MSNFSKVVKAISGLGISFFLIKDMVASGLNFQELKLMVVLLITFVFFSQNES